MILYKVFQFLGTVPFFMWSTVDNMLSNTTWFWGETCPFMVFNTRANDHMWNGECPRYTTVLALGSHLGRTADPPCSGASRKNMGQPQVCYSIRKIWNSTPENFCSGVFPS